MQKCLNTSDPAEGLAQLISAHGTSPGQAAAQRRRKGQARLQVAADNGVLGVAWPHSTLWWDILHLSLQWDYLPS